VETINAAHSKPMGSLRALDLTRRSRATKYVDGLQRSSVRGVIVFWWLFYLLRTISETAAISPVSKMKLRLSRQIKHGCHSTFDHLSPPARQRARRRQTATQVGLVALVGSREQRAWTAVLVTKGRRGGRSLGDASGRCATQSTRSTRHIRMAALSHAPCERAS
jgi:hypothetical protein